MARGPYPHIWQSDEDDRWYWTLYAANHEPVARCAEDGYSTRYEAVRGLRRSQANMARIDV